MSKKLREEYEIAGDELSTILSKLWDIDTRAPSLNERLKQAYDIIHKVRVELDDRVRSLEAKVKR